MTPVYKTQYNSYGNQRKGSCGLLLALDQALNEAQKENNVRSRAVNVKSGFPRGFPREEMETFLIAFCWRFFAFTRFRSVRGQQQHLVCPGTDGIAAYSGEKQNSSPLPPNSPRALSHSLNNNSKSATLKGRKMGIQQADSQGHYWTIAPASEFMFEEGSFRRRPRGFRRKCQALKPMYRMMNGLGFSASLLPQGFDFQAPSAPLACHANGYNLDMMPNSMAGAYEGHHVPHMSPNPGSTYMASCPVPANGEHGPDSSSSPVPSSPAMASAIECHSPYASPSAHWTASGASPYIKQQALPPSNAAPSGIHSSMSSYSLEQSYLHQNAREDLSVGLPRYQHHSSPVCDRKDFVLNFNGISSFHPSASGSYYHHHHHQSVCQDIKPCVM
ncbi:forkhead box protein F2 [Alligator sinensis]|uniref:Forkhead box protein F2 n=1 Tax=Alligator sinensis TaxID=38654 RepID=A0A3Q0GJ04_ALLSI|nr:forkhead box protein F2 [Alligator sinensis]